MSWINKINPIESARNLLPVNSIYDLVEKTKKLSLQLSETHSQNSAWLIINAENNKCKWYCVSNWVFPLVCWRWENCNNINRANQTIKVIDEFEHQKILEDLY